MRAKAKTPPATSAQPAALVVATHGRHCVVETPDGQRLICHPRGKKLAAVVGDQVQWQPSQDEGVIERVLPRRNLLYRQDEVRTKSFAANIDQALILLGAEPEFSERQLARALIACEAAAVTPLVALNKADLPTPFARAWQRLAPYRAMGYAVLPLAAEPQGPVPPNACQLPDLQALLAGRVTLILGPSGAGKSTLINRLVPGAAAQTGAISQALNSGRHTTTSTSWYWLDAARQSALIDSPGFQEFGLHHIGPTQLPGCMPDIRTHAADCRFYNCSHVHEPGCSVRAAVAEGGAAEGGAGIDPNRYKIYGELLAELQAAARAC